MGAQIEIPPLNPIIRAIMLWWSEGLQGGPQLGTHNAEGRQSLGQLLCLIAFFFYYSAADEIIHWALFNKTGYFSIIYILTNAEYYIRWAMDRVKEFVIATLGQLIYKCDNSIFKKVVIFLYSFFSFNFELLLISF